jgi:WXG100 family type VII secretion target
VTSGVSQTQSEAAVMEQTAAKFEQANESLQQMLNSLMSELSVLESAWQGHGGTSFTQVKVQWSNDQAAIQRALAETVAAIRTAGQNYTASDSEAAGRVAQTGSAGIVLPL